MIALITIVIAAGIVGFAYLSGLRIVFEEAKKAGIEPQPDRPFAEFAQRVATAAKETTATAQQVADAFVPPKPVPSFELISIRGIGTVDYKIVFIDNRNTKRGAQKRTARGYAGFKNYPDASDIVDRRLEEWLRAEVQKMEWAGR